VSFVQVVKRSEKKRKKALADECSETTEGGCRRHCMCDHQGTEAGEPPEKNLRTKMKG
jgi:hypothetical protein